MKCPMCKTRNRATRKNGKPYPYCSSECRREHKPILRSINLDTHRMFRATSRLTKKQLHAIRVEKDRERKHGPVLTGDSYAINYS